MVPAFTGLGAPYWDAEARGLISGLTLDSTADQIIVATIQSVAFQVADLFEIMGENGSVAGQLRVDGGMAVNKSFCQFMSDILDLPIETPADIETTARGAALLAGLGAQMWKDVEEIRRLWSPGGNYRPSMPSDRRKALRNEFFMAVERARLRV